MKALILPACFLLLTACSTHTESLAFFAPNAEGQNITTHVQTEDGTATTLHLKSRFESNCCHVELGFSPELAAKGYKLHPILVRRDYHSLWGCEHTESLEYVTGHIAPGQLQLTLYAEQLTYGPRDYSLRLQLLTPDGTPYVTTEKRLCDSYPAPGALSSNPIGARTYHRNRTNLVKLRQALPHCSTIRLIRCDFYTDKRTERTLSATDTAEIRRLLLSMRPVRTQLATVTPVESACLQLLAADGTLLAELNIFDVAAPTQVSPENVAFMRRYALLSTADAEIWHRLTK